MGMRTASKGQLAVRPWTMPGSTVRRVPRAPQRAVSKMTGPPLRGPKPAGVAGLISVTVIPEHKGLLKNTVDFSQYKSDSTSRPARGGRSYLMTLPRKKKMAQASKATSEKCTYLCIQVSAFFTCF